MLEHYYQRHKFEGEDRLLFLLRYSRKRRDEISQQADSVSWDADYVPNESELFESETLTKAYTVWSRLYAYAQGKLAGGSVGRLPHRRSIPRHVEEKLGAYANICPPKVPRRWWDWTLN